ncbi:ZYBA0S10-00738g1_1 [Zygosaccharomyces bailii CLIB 213]|uniref:Peptidyl-tRNA hydrolase n=1 Tax=Zygosaccharomyces bailii (strain CLIB 213 / ATCC 58445 / CBS 680 / BCRC 21525 / NBRC 1098 / NCYC 1416 / NRRL Y-2227) TaxID=1333698 RepID=A0A8J2XA54_ZYGB2|nr:ZYBA0S10-00738g1_1 [Zygosaccharomyces bailii CLIB 213]
MFAIRVGRSAPSTDFVRRLTCLTGIGNPEPQYANTRHNAGLVMLDLLRQRLDSDGSHSYKVCVNAPAKYCHVSPDLLLIRSDGDYINLSGKTVVPLWKRLPHRDAVTHIIVHDELSLPLGKVQLRKPGTSLRGHNGLRSLRSHWGSDGFHRLAIGIGRPHDRDPQVVSDYVLSRFDDREMSILATQSIEKALEQLQSLL